MTSPTTESSAPPTSSVGASLVGGLGHEPEHTEDGDRGQRDVESEDRLPRPDFEQEAGAEQAEDRASAGNAGPDADRLGALLGGEGAGDRRQGCRHHESCADAEHRAQGDQFVGRVRGHRERRAGTEDQQADEEGAAAAELVADRAGRKQQRGEHERVGLDHPLELGLGCVGAPGDIRERDVERRHGRHHGGQGDADHCGDRAVPHRGWVVLRRKGLGDVVVISTVSFPIKVLRQSMVWNVIT